MFGIMVCNLILDVVVVSRWRLSLRAQRLKKSISPEIFSPA